MDSPEWNLSPKALEVADWTFHEQLPMINIEGFSEGVLLDPGQQPLVHDRALRELYADSLFDLHRLLEEIRFEIAFAAMLDEDYQVRKPDPDDDRATKPELDVALSIELIAVLSMYGANAPSPSALTSQLHKRLSGGRHLSRWLAGQLLDSAMLRTVAALDRVATLLHVRSGQEVAKRKDGSYFLPTFQRSALKTAKGPYEQFPEWAELMSLTGHPIYRLVKRYRNGNIHHRRMPTELHGEARVAYWDAGAAHGEEHEEFQVEGVSAEDHFALCAATWNLVLKPAVEGAGSVIAASTPKTKTTETELD